MEFRCVESGRSRVYDYTESESTRADTFDAGVYVLSCRVFLLTNSGTPSQ